ncbi:hypothetical protein [Sporosarcina sp. ZBG7A]|uniref:hypothetical protein n=1 Tax=Sporosarcina sp. ZBG7A TaxID=1582223 RepID=UPI00068DAD9D|nr:hypothetical protein [Sporosarcina sp. ZBG7A]
MSLSNKMKREIQHYLNDNYLPELVFYTTLEEHSKMLESEMHISENTRSLEDVLNQVHETFSEKLLRTIDEKGLVDSDIYKKAHIDRKLFSKIRINPEYRPSKSTVLAFSLALELDLDETQDLLLRAGFALSPSSKSDVIIQFFITEGIYDLLQINEALFAFDQQVLGG